MPSEELSGGSNFRPLSLSEVWKVVISRFNSVGRGANEQARNFRKDLPLYTFPSIKPRRGMAPSILYVSVLSEKKQGLLLTLSGSLFNPQGS